MEKILENTYGNINIELINEMALLCDRIDINIREVVDAAKTKSLLPRSWSWWALHTY